MQDLVKDVLRESAELKAKLLSDASLIEEIEKVNQVLLRALQSGGTIYACGNGGSACDAMHLTEELVAKYKRERIGLRAMHFLDAGTMSCWGNDYDYKDIFRRQAEVFCTEKDVLIGISTSGNSENILRAVEQARKKKTTTVGLLGKGGGRIRAEVDHPIIVPSNNTERIQECHILFIHIFCEFLDQAYS